MTQQRSLAGVSKKAVSIIAISYAIFHLYTGALGSLPAFEQRTIHLCFAMVLTFLVFPFRVKSTTGRFFGITFTDFFLSIISAVVFLYGFFKFQEFEQSGAIANSTDIVIGLIGSVLVIEACRRCLGYSVTILACAFLLYAYFGPYMPGVFMHRGFSITQLAYQMYWTTDGLFSIVLGVSAGYLAILIVFSSIAQKVGLGNFFTNFSLAIAGGVSGGPAKVSIISSSLFGMINGAAMANVATTGMFSIPLMKKTGYSSNFAGAVESTASTGGIIMPPIMGAVAFVMSEFLGVPYRVVMLAAIIPAIFYFGAFFFQVHLEAKKNRLRGLTRAELPILWIVIKEGWYLVSPMIVLVCGIIYGYSIGLTAVVAIVLSVLLTFVKKRTRLSLKQWLTTLENAGLGLISMAVSSAAIGFVVGVIGMTNLGVVIGDNIFLLSFNIYFLSLVILAIFSLIMGMGMAAVPAYIITALIGAPILVKLGVPELSAHFFAFYFATLSMVTPPVALSCIPAVTISGGSYIKTGMIASRLALAGFIVPFRFVYDPILLLIGFELSFDMILQLFIACATLALGIFSLSCAMVNYFIKPMKIIIRAVFIGSGILFILPFDITSILGAFVLLIGIIAQLGLVNKFTNDHG